MDTHSGSACEQSTHVGLRTRTAWRAASASLLRTNALAGDRREMGDAGTLSVELELRLLAGALEDIDVGVLDEDEDEDDDDDEEEAAGACDRAMVLPLDSCEISKCSVHA